MIRSVLVVAAALFAALGAQGQAAEHIIRVDETGWPGIVAEMPKELAPTEVLWIWSDSCAPRRLISLPPGDCPETEAVEVRLTTHDRKPFAGTEIRWGTEEMLRELPDGVLPIAVVDASGVATVRVPKGVPLFGRVAGPGLASRWTELRAPKTTLAAVEAAPVNIVVRDGAGGPATHARVEIRTTDAAPARDLAFTGMGDGGIVIPPIPAGSFVRLLAWSELGAPSMANAVTGRLPPTLSLPHGFVLRGKLIDGKKAPVAGAHLAATFRVPPVEAIPKRARSDKQGFFMFGGLDAREVEWDVRKQGFGVVSRVTRLKGDLDLGEVVLSPEREVRVAVVNRRKQPIRGAFIRTADGIEATANTEGIATLKQVPADGFNARVTVRGYLSREFRAGESAAQPVSVVMRDSAHVRASLVRASDGAPAGPGTIAVELDGAKRVVNFDASGEIDVDGLDAGKLSIEIRALGLSPFRLPPRRIGEGEIVDLGVLQLPAGLAITGRILDDASTAPLAGATIHLLRPSASGPLLSYVQGDWTTAESSTDGRFRAGGLAPAVYALWVDAPGHAPVIRTGVEVRGTEPNAEVDLGDVPLPVGRTLSVVCEPVARCGTIASVLIAGADWMPLTGPIESGAASIAPLPPGPATLRLSDTRGIIHEREITISADDPVTNLHIRLPSIDVSGVITRGGKPAAGGTLLFRTSVESAHFVVQVEHTTSAGSLGSDFFGTMPRTFTAAVSDEGHFELHEIGPGDYSVTWSAGGAQSPPRLVTIPEGSDVTLRIDLPGGAIEGTVRTADGGPLLQVLVSAEQNGARAQMFAAADGTFSLSGLASGPAIVRAVTRAAKAEKSLTLDDGQTAHVELTLQARDDRSLTIAVRANGAPLPNAFVLLRENGVINAATTAGDGTAALRLTRRDGTIEAAVYAPLVGWAFVPPRSEADATELAVDVAPASATLVVAYNGGRIPLSLVAPTGFPIHEALQLLGIPPIAPLRLERLPTGRYSVTARGATQTIELTDGMNKIEF